MLLNLPIPLPYCVSSLNQRRSVWDLAASFLTHTARSRPQDYGCPSFSAHQIKLRWRALRNMYTETRAAIIMGGSTHYQINPFYIAMNRIFFPAGENSRVPADFCQQTIARQDQLFINLQNLRQLVESHAHHFATLQATLGALLEAHNNLMAPPVGPKQNPVSRATSKSDFAASESSTKSSIPNLVPLQSEPEVKENAQVVFPNSDPIEEGQIPCINPLFS